MLWHVTVVDKAVADKAAAVASRGVAVAVTAVERAYLIFVKVKIILPSTGGLLRPSIYTEQAWELT